MSNNDQFSCAKYKEKLMACQVLIDDFPASRIGQFTRARRDARNKGGDKEHVAAPTHAPAEISVTG